MVVSLGRRTFAIALLLAALAGFIDAMGFITLGGFFVSFMSGNSTQMAVFAVDGAFEQAAIGATIIGLFVGGVLLGSLIGHRTRHGSAVLVFVAISVAAAAIGAAFDAPTQVVISALVLAMGAENTVFERSDASSVSLTYMTGTLVKLGQRIAAALVGGPRWAWVRFALLWLGLVLGVVAGAAVHRWIGLQGLWIGVAVALFLAAAMARLPART
ncbi:YoaK family protein [Rhodococcus sp. NPDC058514]|uniref:YoaK family protein n=1 Tax=unclassified Rhodococcus (in: high G+C Gram-positive bacteria) TaxID=192944 RepID=UPI0036595457